MLIGSGGNTESGRINQVMASARRCAIAEGLQRANNMYCPPIKTYGSPVNEGARLQGKMAVRSFPITSSNSYIPAVPITSSNSYIPAAFVPESVRILRIQQESLSDQPRFASYIRFNPPPACPPLPAAATNAGEPVPSFNNCLPNKNSILA
jgi:hypothetical protein